MPYPVEASEVDSFTPSSLRNIPTPPAFKFRTVNHRLKRAFRQTAKVEGLEYHSLNDIRDCILEGFKANYTPESYEQGEPRLKAYWEAVDHALKEREKLQMSEAEIAHANALISAIVESWLPARVMLAQLDTYNEMIGKIAISVFCIGWSDLNVTFKREADVIPLETVDDVEDALAAAEAQNAKADGVLKGLAFIELCNHALSCLGLAKEEEKNSSSLSPNDLTQELSADGKEPTTALSSTELEPSTSEPSE